MVRVIIATIRNLGDCPCPRCLVKKEELDQLGTVTDILIRETKARRDDDARRDLVESAISKIATQGVALSGKVIENLLKPQSLQPVMVR